MVSAADTVAAVDQFLHTEKVIVGADQPVIWNPGFLEGERQIHFPLELNGEQSGARLMVVGFPEADFLKFRLGILFPGAICRLDFTDEVHPNTASVAEDGIPPIVSGPHYHTWKLNRRFCRGGSLPPKLHNAEPFGNHGGSFDAILRWFCADNMIASLPANHMIELPPRTHLL